MKNLTYQNKMNAYSLHRIADNVGQEAAAKYLLFLGIDNAESNMDYIKKLIALGEINKYELRDAILGVNKLKK